MTQILRLDLYFEHHVVLGGGVLQHFWKILRPNAKRRLGRIVELASGECVMTLLPGRIVECANVQAAQKLCIAITQDADEKEAIEAEWQAGLAAEKKLRLADQQQLHQAQRAAAERQKTLKSIPLSTLADRAKKLLR